MSETTGREALANAIHGELFRAEHGCDGTPKGCYDTCPVPAYEVLNPDQQVAVTTAAALAYIAAVLSDDATVEAIENRGDCEHEWAAWREHDAHIHCIPCDLAVVAERFGIEAER